MPSSRFEAYRKLMAGDLPRPDWRVSAGDDDREERRARDELAGKLRAVAAEIGVCCSDAIYAWQTQAAPVVRRREAREACRAMMRLILRAWREQADGRRAYEDEWKEHMRTSGKSNGNVHQQGARSRHAP